MAPIRSPGDLGAGYGQPSPQPVYAPAPAAYPTYAPAPAAANEQLRRIQARLTSLGYDVGPADGRMGPKTSAAIAQAAASAGLPARPEPTPEFLRALGL